MITYLNVLVSVCLFLGFFMAFSIIGILKNKDTMTSSNIVKALAFVSSMIIAVAGFLAYLAVEVWKG